MDIRLDFTKSVDENAAVYFEKSKQAKAKIEGAQETVERFQKKLDVAESEVIEESIEEVKEERKKHWYEKFRWFISSEGFLCVGGRDATTNEIIIKKHADKGDKVFHTDMSGSPFFVVKAEGKEVGEATLDEAATATFVYSRAWKLGLQTAEVFWVEPDQVTKEANTGEYLSKGAFMIRGKTTYVRNFLPFGIGITEEGAVMGATESALKKNCKEFLLVEQGSDKASDIAKKIKAKIGGELDDIIRVLPVGGCKIRK